MMAMDDPVFKIAEAAKLVGVSVSTLRLWETQGLVRPSRTPSGQRLYDRILIEKLKFIYWQRTDKGHNLAAIKDALKSKTSKPKKAKEGLYPRKDALIGYKIRLLRRKAGKTLKVVAKDTGLAVSRLSLFERTSQGLSFAALHTLARYFGTTIATLGGHSNKTNSVSLIRDQAWPVWPATSPGVVIQMLTNGQHQMECHRFVLAPGASSKGTYCHEGEEFIYILSGQMDIMIDGSGLFRLKTGDSFYFESCKAHSWFNSHDEETILIWINTPPTV